MLDLGPNPRFWAQIGQEVAYFQKILFSKAENSSIHIQGFWTNGD